MTEKYFKFLAFSCAGVNIHVHAELHVYTHTHTHTYMHMHVHAHTHTWPYSVTHIKSKVLPITGHEGPEGE